MFVKQVRLVRCGHKVAWMCLHVFPDLLLLFSLGSKFDSITSTTGRRFQRGWKRSFPTDTMIYFHCAFGGLTQESWRHKRRPYGHVRVKNYQIICLSSFQGPALSSLGPKLQKTTHCGHYFNTVSTTPPPQLSSFQMMLIMPNSDPFSQQHSCKNAIRFNLGVMTDCLKDFLCTLVNRDRERKTACHLGSWHWG